MALLDLNNVTTAMRIAIKTARKSNCPVASMACVITHGGKILSAKCNGVGRGRGRGVDHAEVRALRKHMDYRGASLLVVRLNGSGSSRPCPACWQKIIKAGISTVTYTDTTGATITMRVNGTACASVHTYR